eukprot:TRINITY_DN44273_c0_g1_i1.p1 TRINITY_DN44273_c0_g1~~TRINITY_DN44273_c0_g1_i1.p1  ORF type:complete len:379 (-),score=83.52 TRINITY_DN44273_c0_g1_i1:120-1256(-)
MNCRPFESAASELVDESAHPIQQLEILEGKARELTSQGDHDAVIECRIKQLCLQRVLGYLHDFPLQPLVRAQAALAEAYAAGSYFTQAKDHLAQAREVCSGGVHDDAQCRRLQADILAAEGCVNLSEGRLEAAERILTEAAKVGREVCGELDERAARVHHLLGKVATQRGNHDKAVEYFSTAWEVHEALDGAEAEATLRVRLRVAEAQNAAGRAEDAIHSLSAVLEALNTQESMPSMLVEAASQLARWLEAEGRDTEALEALQTAEVSMKDYLGPEDPKVVDVKRDVALLHLKLGDHDTALQYLNDVHYLERRLHGSQSANVARTLKALGTVHLVRRNFEEAERCLLQALRIFEADHPPHTAIIKDIHLKLSNIASRA